MVQTKNKLARINCAHSACGVRMILISQQRAVHIIIKYDAVPPALSHTPHVDRIAQHGMRDLRCGDRKKPTASATRGKSALMRIYRRF